MRTIDLSDMGLFDAKVLEIGRTSANWSLPEFLVGAAVGIMQEGIAVSSGACYVTRNRTWSTLDAPGH